MKRSHKELIVIKHERFIDKEIRSVRLFPLVSLLQTCFSLCNQ